MTLSLTVGRDYRTNSKYEYVIFEDEGIVTRAGFFTTSTQAKRGGIKAVHAIYNERDWIAPELAL